MNYKPRRNWAQEFDERADAAEEARQARKIAEMEKSQQKPQEEMVQPKSSIDKPEKSEPLTEIIIVDLFSQEKKSDRIIQPKEISSQERITIEMQVAIDSTKPMVKKVDEACVLYECENGQMSFFRPEGRRTVLAKGTQIRSLKDLYYEMTEQDL